LIETDDVHVTLPELSQRRGGGGVLVGIHEVDGGGAEFEVRTELANDGAETVSLTLRTTLQTETGEILLTDSVAVGLRGGEHAEIAKRYAVSGVTLWHPDHPRLYTLRTEALRDGKTADSLCTRFGFRLFELRDGEGLLINKKPIGRKLSGMNRHQDYAQVGNALPNSGQWRDALLLKEAGCDIVRAAHYPFDPAFMDACDALGILTTVANPGWQFYNAENPLFARRVTEDTRAMARRDRNRPSVLLWETVLNETDGLPIPLIAELREAAREELPFPGVFTCADYAQAKAAGLELYYDQSGTVTEKCSFTREYGDGWEVDNFYSQNAVPRVKREWGERAMLGQAAVRAGDLERLYAAPPVSIGGALWCGIDHQRGYHPEQFLGGLLDVYRVPKYAYYFYKSQRARQPFIYIAHELTQASGSEVVIFTNCEQARLIWLGRDCGVKSPKKGFAPHPPIIFGNLFDFREIAAERRDDTENIQMVAEGIIGGKTVCRQVKRYPERLSGIRLETDGIGIGLTADGSDFIPVRAVMIDNKGVPKVLSDEYITFTAEGPGEIIGDGEVGVNPVKTRFGTATALVRAGLTAGDIRVTAHCPAIGSDSVMITSTPPVTPMLYDAAYAAAGKTFAPPAVKMNTGGGGSDTLRSEVKTLKLKLIGKEQEIMELRSRIGG
jgi:beta-galactosidase